MTDASAPATAAQAPTEAYLFAYFTGREQRHSDEQIYFSVSRDGAHWHDLRADGDPVLASPIGEKGVRDPYLLRKHDNSGFVLIATDLSIHGRGGWGHSYSTVNGSTGLIIWESPDLVHWSNARLVDVASQIPGAGMAWAPEAVWDDERSQYIVFWSTAANGEFGSPLSNAKGNVTNLYYATTTDFSVFSDPVRWIDVEHSIIDTTMLKADDGWWYRVSKDDRIVIERTKNPYALTESIEVRSDPEQWSLVGSLQSIFGNERYSARYLEGPELFRYNDRDVRTVNGRRMAYGLMADQYHESKGYLPFRCADLASADPADWQSADDVDFGPLKKRHGTILPITDTEYRAVVAAFER